MLNILVIDDDEQILKLLNMILQEKYNVRTVSNIKDIFNILKEKEYKIILSDVNLKNISGIKLCYQIREQYPNMKIIGMSGFPLDEIECFDKFIQKPFKMKILFNTINGVIKNERYK